MSGNRKSLQQSFILKLLATWGRMMAGGDFLEERTTGYSNRQCLRKVANGHFTAVVKVISTSGGYATASDLLKSITSVINLWLARRCPPILVEFVASAPLTPLLKPDNGIQPIAVGTIWRRLVSKVAIKGVDKEMSKYQTQFLSLELVVSVGIEDVLTCVTGWQMRLYRRHNIYGLATGVASRTCMEEAALFFVKGLCGSIESMMGCEGPFFGELQWRLASLPIRFGGLGLYSAKVASPYAFVASRAQSWVLQDHILRDSGICGMDDDYVSTLDFKDMKLHFEITVRQKSVFECLRAPHAHDFLLAILIDGLDQHMSPVEYRIILKYRLMIPLFPVDGICPVCRKACLRAEISAKKEAPVNFLSDPLEGRSTLKPAYVLIFGWVGGKHACVDLTGISPLMGLISRGFSVV
ncbi:hypothetical protein Tco_0735135 [Tanacetum coccineum]